MSKCHAKDCTAKVRGADILCDQCSAEMERILRAEMATRMGRAPTDQEFERSLTEFLAGRPN